MSLRSILVTKKFMLHLALPCSSFVTGKINYIYNFDVTLTVRRR